MKLNMILLAVLAGLPLTTNAAEPNHQTPVIAGSWNVMSTQNSDNTCFIGKPGDIAAYIWIINQSADGKLSIAVQGKTSFPELSGKFHSESGSFVLFGYDKQSYTSSWLKLKLNQNGELVGVRRYLGRLVDTKYPCFVDSNVVAKKQ